MSDTTPPSPEQEAKDPAPADPRTSGLEAFRMIEDVEVELTLEIGRRRLRIAEVLGISVGNTVQLTKAAGEPIDILVNGRLLGRGEAVVVGDRYGVRITELTPPHNGALR